MSLYTKYYKDIPPVTKGIATLAVLGVAIYAAYLIRKGIVQKKDRANSQGLIVSASNELMELKKKGITPTLTDSQLQTFVGSLTTAMDGCGTTWDSVKTVFTKMKNKADVIKFIMTFGIQYYQPCPISQPLSYTKWLLDNKSYGGNLAQWMEYELTSGEKKDINAILAKNKIDYTF